MVPTGVVERDVPLPAALPATAPPTVVKTLRSHAQAQQQRTPGDGDALSPATAAADATAAAAMEAEAAGRHRRRRRRRRRKNQDVPVDNLTRIKRRVKYMIMKMRLDQNLIDAYSGEGWKGQSREKIRPEQELQRAEAQILKSKLNIREAIHELDDLGLEGSLDQNAFDSEGRIYHEEIFCAKCKSQEALPDNDIILCDGACNRGFHQYCLEPPLATKDIPPGDEGWLCPVCECKMECVEVINAYLGTNFEVENGWEELFAEEALVAAGGGAKTGAGGDWPSTDSEDDDYDPESLEKRANSQSDSENKGGDDDDSSGSGSDFRDSDASPSPSSDKGGKGPSPSPSASLGANLKRLARKGKPNTSKKEESGSSQSSDSDDSDVSLVDEFKEGGVNAGLRRRDSQAEESASDEEAMIIGGKRHRKAVDYKKLHDEMFGNTELDDDLISEDDDWGPKRRRRRTIPDDPSRPRPPKVRRRRARALSGDASRGSVADGVPSNLPSGSQGDGAADTPGAVREKRMWRKLPEIAIEALRRVVAVNTLPSKSCKEELASQLGISFSQAFLKIKNAFVGLDFKQVHGWFKNQRHQALKKGLVVSKRPHLAASSSKTDGADNGVEVPAAEGVAATEITTSQNENNSNIYLTEKLDEVQLRLLELKQTLEDFAKTTAAVDAEVGSVEVENSFGNGGIGLPANGKRVVYVPVAEVRERPSVGTHTSAC